MKSINNSDPIKTLIPNKRKMALNMGFYAAFFIGIIVLNITTTTGIFSTTPTATSWFVFILIEGFFAFRFIHTLLKINNSKIILYNDRLEVTYALKTKTALYNEISQLRFTSAMAPSLLLRNKMCMIYFKTTNKPRMPIQINIKAYVDLYNEFSILSKYKVKIEKDVNLKL